MSKLSRAIIWYLTSIAMLVFLYYGLFQEIGWAKNVGMFLIWLAIFTHPLVYICDDVKAKIHDMGRSVPKAVSITFDVVGICILAAAAHYVTAVLYLLACSCENSIFDGE